jgi:ATPase subunit of ABC transporter with duplicated ATPase domains
MLRPAAARWSPASTGPWCAAGRSRSGPSTSRSGGPNGSGKSTLLAALLGRLPLDEGTQRLGAGVVLGEIDQGRGVLDEDQPLLAAYQVASGIQAAADARTRLAKFGLGADHVTRTVGSLSPGERTRTTLTTLTARGVNCLVLDEPTNHLDLPAIEQLEEAVEAFEGTVLLVTHDRRLLEAVSVTRTLTVDAGVVVEA